MNHVYFWDSIAWALAVHLIILQPVICVQSQWLTAPVFWVPFAFSATVQLFVILMCSTLSSWTFSLPLHLFTSESMEPIPQVFRYVCTSCQVVCHLPPHTESGQRARLCGAVSHPLSSQHQRCQRCGHRKYILLRNLFVTEASPRPGCKHMLYFWSSHSLILS